MIIFRIYSDFVEPTFKINTMIHLKKLLYVKYYDILILLDRLFCPECKKTLIFKETVHKTQLKCPSCENKFEINNFAVSMNNRSFIRVLQENDLMKL